MRIDKFIGNSTGLSRSEIHIAIKQGRILLNDMVINKTNVQMAATDFIYLDSKKIEARQPRYLMLHKPTGYVSANQDSEHPTLLDLINLPFKHELQIVGRLDVDTTGLVLLTDDGQWNHKITSPKHLHTKTYYVHTANPITNNAVQLFAEGLMLKGESKATLPAELCITQSHQARLKICEGKYHQVKRMFAAIGNHVTRLHREAIGTIALDASLPEGGYRDLTRNEVESFEK